MKKPRASVAIVRGNTVLLIRRTRKGERYYILPGGGIEEGETPWVAAVREAKEELGIRMTDGREIGTFAYPDSNRTEYVHAALLDAESREPRWREQHKVLPDNRFDPVWTNLDEVPALTMVPALAEILLTLRPND